MVISTITYLARDELYQREKPFATELVFEGAEDVPQRNYIFSHKRINFQPIEESDLYDLEAHGFCVIRAATNLDAVTALQSPEKAEEAYTSELATILQARLPQYSRIEPIDFVVRKRDERFPSNQYGVVSHQQPTALAHADYTVDGATMQLNYTFPNQEAYFRDREYDMINVWRPLTGPNDDWPLAVCDFTSIDSAQDIVAADLLYSNRLGENQLLHFNSRHRWYYIPRQQPEDLLVFRNVDSTGKRPTAFHSAFHNPTSESPPRQSCEVRFVAFRA